MMTITKRKIRGAQRLLPLLRDDKDDDNAADGGGIIVGTLCLSSYYHRQREAVLFLTEHQACSLELCSS
jgi:hypothetical protein